MSIKTVRAEIRKALEAAPYANKDITAAEAKAIVAKAEIGPVTRGEVSEVKRLIEKGIVQGQMMTMMYPELRGDQFYVTPEAKTVLTTFVVRHGQSVSPGGAVTLAIPENPSDAVTLAIPENPSDGMMVTLAIPENPTDAAH